MNSEEQRPARWWREIQLLWLVLLVGGIYFSRISDLNLLGEETRRAQVAREMLWSGDWTVPRQQGELYLSRPPLGSWVIAVAGILRGSVDTVSVRLPTLLAVLATAISIYGYSRNFLSRTGVFLAGTAYPTMAQVLQLGRVAESEGLFTLFISASLLVWHGGYLKQRSRWIVWTAGYVLAALAGLTKGPQGIAYFAGPVWCYLLFVEREWKELIRPGHLIGAFCGVLVIGLWQVPFMSAVGPEPGTAIWFTQAANRFDHANLAALAEHLVLFPLEILACTLPWSLVLVQFLNPHFRRSIQGLRKEVGFLLVALAVTFPTVWLAPHARGRYFMPLYPLFAVLCGMVLERCAFASPSTWMNRGWRQWLLGFAAAGIFGGAAVSAFAFRPDWLPGGGEISPRMAAAFVIVALAVGGWLVLRYRSPKDRDIQISTAALAALLGMTYTGVIVSTQVARQPSVDRLLAEVRAEVPEQATLVSFDRVAHAFAYYYGEFIPQQPWPSAFGEQPAEYFCCLKEHLKSRPLPFAWEPIAEMTFEDDENPSPWSYVIVGRRIKSSGRPSAVRQIQTANRKTRTAEN